MVGGLAAEKKLRWSFFNADCTAVSPPGRAVWLAALSMRISQRSVIAS
jgi:hypothetical protein